MYVCDWVRGNHRPFTWRADEAPEDSADLGTILARGDTMTLRVTPVEYAWYGMLADASRNNDNQRLQTLWRATLARNVSEQVSNALQDVVDDDTTRTTAYRLAAMTDGKARARPQRRALVTYALADAIHTAPETVETGTFSYVESAAAERWTARDEEVPLQTAVESYVETFGRPLVSCVAATACLNAPAERPATQQHETGG